MTSDHLFAAIDGTWPAAETTDAGPWRLRDGQGGGQRVSATTAIGPVRPDDIPDAEAAMAALNQPALFMIRPQDQALDAMLDARGYAVRDPVNLRICPAVDLTDQPIPKVRIFPVWPPLAIMRDIWADGGIGPSRIAVMERAAGPKTGILARWNDKPAGVAYVAVHDGIAMVHAVEVVEDQRRQGVAQWMMRAAAIWACQNDAETLAVLCTKANTGANRLYAGLSMRTVAEYHYRRKA